MFLPTGHRVVDDLFVGVQQALTRVAEGVEGPSFDQGLNGPLVEHRCVAPFGEVVEVGERTVGCPLGFNQLHQAFTHVTYRGKPEDDPPGRCVRPGGQVRNWLEVRASHVDVGHSHLDTQHSALVEVDGSLVQVGPHTGQQGSQVLHRIVGL